MRILTGGCACGQLTFRAAGEPKRVGLCHCLTCRKISGSPFGAFAIYSAEQVNVEGRFSGWGAEDTQRCFCPTCGSRVFSRTYDEVEIGLGAFDEPNVLAPTYELWTIRKEHWLHTEQLTPHRRNRDENT